MDPQQSVMVVAVVGFTLVAALWDFRTKKLPNWLTVPAFAAALVFHLTTGALSGGWGGAMQSLGFALGGFAVGFGILLLMWLMGSGGAGDVKLMGAVGAWLGALNTFYVFLISAVFIAVGSFLTLTISMIVHGVYRTRHKHVGGQARQGESQSEFKSRRRILPYGVPVAFATWSVLAWQAYKLTH